MDEYSDRMHPFFCEFHQLQHLQLRQGDIRNIERFWVVPIVILVSFDKIISISELKQLVHLDLAHNQISRIGELTLPSSLKVLILDENPILRIKHTEISTIFQNLSRCVRNQLKPKTGQ